MARLPVQALARAGAMQMLSDYAAANPDIKLSTYPGRPRSVNPPHAFVDAMGEDLTASSGLNHDRQPTVEILIVWGTFDSLEAVNQRDAFMDGFVDWVSDRPHAFGDNTIVEPVSFRDDPAFKPDWLVNDPRIFFATRLILEGFANT